MSTTRFLLLAAAAVLALVLATHGRSVWADHGFVNYDDGDVVVSNPRVQSLTAAHVGEILTRRTFHSWLPLYFLSLALDRAVLGAGARGHHLVNVLLHALNAFLVVALLTRLTRHARIAIGAGLLFSVLPGLTESVAWISSRKDVLSLTFMLLSMLLATRSVKPAGGVRAGPYAGALVLLAFALMTKGTVLVMPLLLVAHRLVARSEEEKRETLPPLLTAPFFLVAGVFTLVHYLIAADETVVGDATGGSLPGLLVANLGVLGRYVVTLVVMPAQTVAHHVVPGRFDLWAGGGIVVLAGLAWAIVAGWRRAPLLVLGVLWFVLALAPFNNVLPRTSLLMAERYLYVPALGAVLALAWALGRLPRPWFARALAAAVVLLGAQTIVRTGVWADSEVLWRDAVRKAPESYLVHQKLGRALFDAGKGTEARASLEEALARVVLPVHEIRTRSELSILLLMQGRPGPARAQVEAALALLPEVPAGRVRNVKRSNLLVHRANARKAEGENDGALEDYREAARLDEDNAAAPYNAGSLLLSLGRTAEAEPVLAEAVRRGGVEADALLHLSAARLALGRLSEARATLARAEAAGADADAVLLLEAEIVTLEGDPEKADAMLERAARTRRRGSRIHRALARRRLKKARDALGDGDVRRARELAREAIEWEPRSAVLRLLNARILRAAGEPEAALEELESAALRGGSQAGVARERAEIFVLLAAAEKAEGKTSAAAARLGEALAEDVSLLDAGGMVLDGRLLRLARAALESTAGTPRGEAFASGLLDLVVGEAKSGREALLGAAGDARDELARVALALRGAAFAASGLPGRAATSLREALVRNEASTDVRLLLAEVLEMSGDAKAARAEYERVLARDGESLPAAVGVALNLGREGQVVAALARLNELAAKYPDRAEVPRALGQFYWERHATSPGGGMLESAERSFLKALVADSTDVRTLEFLALVLSARGLPDRAVPLLRRAVVLRPDRSGARTNLARLYVRAGRAHLEKGALDEAEDLASRATMLAPELGEAVLFQGDVEKTRKRYGSALERYERARALDPDADAPVDALATWYRDSGYRRMLAGDRDGARSDFLEAIALGPQNVDLETVKGILDSQQDREDSRRGWMALLGTGQTMLAEGKPAEAEKCARAALRIQPKNADAHHLLGRARFAAGDQEGAETSYLAALESRPEFADVELNLGSLCFLTGRVEEAEVWYRAYLVHVDVKAPGAAENISMARAMVKRLRERRRRRSPEDGR